MTEAIRTQLQRVDWRLGRAIALVAIGAALHLPLPGQAVAPTPPMAPLSFADLTPRRSTSRLHVERTTVVAPTTAELERRSPPARQEAPPTAPAAAGRNRSASLIGVRPAGVRNVAVSTTGSVVPAERHGSGDASHHPAVADAPAPTAERRPEAPLQPVDGAASAPMPHAPVESSRWGGGAAPSTASTPTPITSEEDRVRRLLDEYAGAYERLDAHAAQAVYPSVDEKALKKAFARLASQRLRLQSCGITISGSTANAICRGTATYQPRIGTRPVQIASREWTFDLSKQDTAWKIVNTFIR